MKKLTLIALAGGALLSLVACSTPDPAKPADGTTTAAAEAKIYCDREAPTGSMLTKKQCGPVQSEAERARLTTELQNIRRSTGSQPGGK